MIKPTLLTLTLALAGAANAQVAQSQVTVEHDLGRTTLNSTPKRIVVLEYSFADHLATLGVKPVGWARENSAPDYLLPAMKSAAAVGTRAQPSLEKILALKPDLIVADLTRHKALYPQLSRIAPTVVFNSLRGSYDDQLSAFEKLSVAVDRQERGKSMLAQQQRLIEKAKILTDRAQGPLVVGVLSPNLFTAHSSESFIGSLFEQLGRKNALTPRGGETQFAMTLEGLATVNPSAIVLLKNEGDRTPHDDWQQSALWKSLGAVQAGRVYVFDRDLWSKSRGLAALDRIVKQATTSGVLTGRRAD